jgi:hypothetical protein
VAPSVRTGSVIMNCGRTFGICLLLLPYLHCALALFYYMLQLPGQHTKAKEVLLHAAA